MPLFVISFEYLAKPLMIFLAHSPYLSKSTFSQYSPLCHLKWGFARPLMDSCPIPHFLKFAIFVKIVNCQFACFVVSLSQSLPNSPVSQNIPFVKPTSIDMPFLTSFFQFVPNLQYIFAKFFIFVKLQLVKMPVFVISFEYLAKPLTNFKHTRHFCGNSPFFA